MNKEKKTDMENGKSKESRKQKGKESRKEKEKEKNMGQGQDHPISQTHFNSKVSSKKQPLPPVIKRPSTVTEPIWTQIWSEDNNYGGTKLQCEYHNNIPTFHNPHFSCPQYLHSSQVSF